MVATFTSSLTSARVEPAAATTPSTPLSVKSGEVTFDRTWFPYIQGQLICQALTASQAAAADPRKGLAVKFTLGQDFAGSLQQLPLVAWLRKRPTDLITTNETTIGFASIESLLQDYTDEAGMAYDDAATTDVIVVNAAYSSMRWDMTSAYPIGPLTTLDGTAAVPIAINSAGWRSGATLWSAIADTEEAVNLWTRGDETGLRLVRSAPGWASDTSSKTYTGSDRIIGVSDDIDRDNPDWANSVFINYPNATTGTGTTDYGNVGTGVPRKSVVLTRQAKKAKAGAAQAIAARMAARGRIIRFRAISDLTLRPNMTRRVQYRGYDYSGVVQAVTFRHPEGLMDVTLNVIES